MKFLSRWARAYDPVVRLMGFAALWRGIVQVAAPDPGQRVLDVCTGTGGAALELIGGGARVVGVDLAEGMLRQAVRKGGDDGLRARPLLARMDAALLGFPDGSFSLVTCSMALHEMAEAEREQVLREIRRVASDRVVIAEYRVPADCSRSLLFRVARFFEYIESDDFESFVRCGVNGRLERAGFLVGPPRDVGAYRIWPCRVRA